jgi:hypothetical protein
MITACSRWPWDRGTMAPRSIQTVLVAGVVIALLLWGWLDVRRRALPQNGQMTDVTVYLAAARALESGQDIYDVRSEQNWPYLYPPILALLFVPLSHLSRGAAAYVWFLMSVGALGTSVVLVRAALGTALKDRADLQAGPPAIPAEAAGSATSALALPARAALMGLAVVAVPAIHTLQRGQVNCLVLLLVCLALFALGRRWHLLGGASLGMAAAVKVTPGFVVVYFIYRWVRGQVAAVREGAWGPRTPLRGIAAPIGFALGLFLGMYAIPALYVGPGQAAVLLSSWRAKVAAGYVTVDAAQKVFAGTQGIHEINDKNQTWYRVIVAYVTLLNPQALAKRNELRPEWKAPVWWILVGVGTAVTGGLLWLCRSDWTRHDAASYAAVAAFIWLGISLGKIGWSHFYVVVYPLAAVAWFLAETAGGSRIGKALRLVCLGVALAYLLHYALFIPVGLGRYGTLLIPTMVLAAVTLVAARDGRGPRRKAEAAAAGEVAVGR